MDQIKELHIKIWGLSTHKVDNTKISTQYIIMYMYTYKYIKYPKKKSNKNNKIQRERERGRSQERSHLWLALTGGRRRPPLPEAVWDGQGDGAFKVNEVLRNGV